MTRSEVVIVGGGIYGCYVAWALARSGVEVLVLEAGEITGGASGGAGKRGVRANYRDLRELPLMRAAYEIWPTLHVDIDADTGYEQIGGLELIERESDLEPARARAWMQNQQGIPTRVLDRTALEEIEPDLASAVIAALHCPLDGVSDHTATTRGVAAAAQRAGATVHEGVAAVGIERQGDRIAAVLTSHDSRVEVGRSFALLSNAEVPGFLDTHLGVALPVWTRLPQVVLSEPVEQIPMRHLIGHAHRTLAMKRGPARNVMISGGWSGRINRDTGLPETVSAQVEGNVAEAVAVYPCLEGLRVEAAFADRRETQTPDGVPIIDRIPGATNGYFATGWCGHGWAISPSVSALIGEWIISGARPELLAPFSYKRFTG